MRGFSLYELLVVMAILAVLLAVLLPALSGAKRRAETVQCGARLRSWGVSLNLYAADHGGVYPYNWVNDNYHYMRLLEPYVEPGWKQDLPWAWADGTVIAGGSNRRIDRRKAGCPAYVRTWTQEKYAPGFPYQVEPLPYAYNAARTDYYYWRAQQVGLGWTGSNPFFAFHQRYISDMNGGAGIDDIGFAQKRRVPHTLLYIPSQSIIMSCGHGSHWKCGRWGVVAAWSSNPFGNPDGWDATQDNWEWKHEELRGIHAGADNHLFMDGHVENLKIGEPKLNFYMYNRIPARGNPWPG